jgi:hypothetical protein
MDVRNKPDWVGSAYSVCVFTRTLWSECYIFLFCVWVTKKNPTTTTINKQKTVRYQHFQSNYGSGEECILSSKDGITEGFAVCKIARQDIRFQRPWWVVGTKVARLAITLCLASLHSAWWLQRSSCTLFFLLSSCWCARGTTITTMEAEATGTMIAGVRLASMDCASVTVTLSTVLVRDCHPFPPTCRHPPHKCKCFWLVLWTYGTSWCPTESDYRALACRQGCG